jgi:hypothetical protein
MLILYATYTSPHPGVSSLVNEATLKRLHDRTVSILREGEHISPVLARDLEILQYLRTNVFLQSWPIGSTALSPYHRFNSGRQCMYGICGICTSVQHRLGSYTVWQADDELPPPRGVRWELSEKQASCL